MTLANVTDVSWIVSWAGECNGPADDKVLDEIGPRVRERGFYDREDFLAVGKWQSPRATSQTRGMTRRHDRGGGANSNYPCHISQSNRGVPHCWRTGAKSGARVTPGVRSEAFRATGSLGAVESAPPGNWGDFFVDPLDVVNATRDEVLCVLRTFGSMESGVAHLAVPRCICGRRGASQSGLSMKSMSTRATSGE